MGATSGIGKEVAILLADKGWIVGIAGRRTELLQRLQTQHKGIACWECIDVTQDDASGRLLQLIDRLGGMDLYFHSSGIGWQNNSLDEYKEMKTMQPMAWDSCAWLQHHSIGLPSTKVDILHVLLPLPVPRVWAQHQLILQPSDFKVTILNVSPNRQICVICLFI